MSRETVDSRLARLRDETSVLLPSSDLSDKLHTATSSRLGLWGALARMQGVVLGGALAAALLGVLLTSFGADGADANLELAFDDWQEAP